MIEVARYFIVINFTKLNIFPYKFCYIAIIPYHLCRSDDVIQNSRRVPTTFGDTASVNWSYIVCQLLVCRQMSLAFGPGLRHYRCYRHLLCLSTTLEKNNLIGFPNLNWKAQIYRGKYMEALNISVHPGEKCYTMMSVAGLLGSDTIIDGQSPIPESIFLTLTGPKMLSPWRKYKIFYGDFRLNGVLH